MAFEVLASTTATGALMTSGSDPVSLLGPVEITATGGNVQIGAYVEGVYTEDSGTLLRVVVDGEIVGQGQHNAFAPLMLVLALDPGTHTIDCQVVSNYFDVNLGDRGLVVLSLV